MMIFRQHPPKRPLKQPHLRFQKWVIDQPTLIGLWLIALYLSLNSLLKPLYGLSLS